MPEEKNQQLYDYYIDAENSEIHACVNCKYWDRANPVFFNKKSWDGNDSPAPYCRCKEQELYLCAGDEEPVILYGARSRCPEYGDDLFEPDNAYLDALEECRAATKDIEDTYRSLDRYLKCQGNVM